MGKSNIADAFKTQQEMMCMSGIWPKKNPSIFYKIKYFISWIFNISLWVTMTMQVIHDLNDFVKLSEILYIMVTIAGTIAKVGTFNYQRETFLKMIDFLKEPVFISYDDELDHYMAKNVRRSTFIAKLYRYLVTCCMIMFTVYPIIDNKDLPFPFSFELGSYVYCMYVFQIISIGCCAWNNSSIDTLNTSLMGIGAGQLSILYEKIVNIENSVNDVQEGDIFYVKNNDTAQRLKQCVEHHKAIIILIGDIEQVFTLGLLAQFITSVMVICNTLFHIVLVSSINSQFAMLLNYFIIILIQLFMLCWHGNEIILKSLQIKEACYQFKWYTKDHLIRKHLFIIMERSKRPLAITTLSIATLSLTSFTSVLQWSYSCLALLVKMYQKQGQN